MIKQLWKAVAGSKMQMKARVFRVATGKWEDRGIIASGRRGGLVEPLRILYRWIIKHK